MYKFLVAILGKNLYSILFKIISHQRPWISLFSWTLQKVEFLKYARCRSNGRYRYPIWVNFVWNYRCFFFFHSNWSDKWDPAIVKHSFWWRLLKEKTQTNSTNVQRERTKNWCTRLRAATIIVSLVTRVFIMFFSSFFSQTNKKKGMASFRFIFVSIKWTC